MTATALESILRRDRAVVAAALAVVTVSTWAYVLWLVFAMDMSAGHLLSQSHEMPQMPEMPGRIEDHMPGMPTSALAPWSASDAVFMVAMWAAMMVGMMTPSAAPMILIY